MQYHQSMTSEMLKPLDNAWREEFSALIRSIIDGDYYCGGGWLFELIYE